MSRFLEKQVMAIRNNAKKIVGLIYPACGSFKELIIKESKQLTDFKKLREMLTESGSKYKLEQLGPAIFEEFLKNIGLRSFKIDVHMIRLFKRLGLAKHPSEIRSVAEEWAKAVKIDLIKLDYRLWLFCADGYGEVCTERKPNCGICLLKQEYCQHVK